MMYDMDPYGLDPYAQRGPLQPGTAGTASPQGGFLSRLNGAFAPFGGLGNVGLQILANQNSGESTGAIIGQSLLQGQQNTQQAKQRELQQKYMQAQIQALNTKDTSPIITHEGDIGYDRATGKQIFSNPKNNDPASVKEYEYGLGHGFKGSFEDWLAKPAGDAPSNVREWQYFSQLSKDQQLRYLEMRRNPNMFVKEVNGAPTAITGAPGGAVNTTPLTTPEQEAAARRKLADAVAAGQKTGESVAASQFDFPRIEQNTNQAIETVDQLINHPGLPYITGGFSKLPIIPGTKQAAADALDRQVHGQTFLQAYQALRGGGQISDTEGTKAEGALARASRAQSTPDYVSAMKEFKGYLSKGMDRARQQARLGITPVAPAEVGGNQDALPDDIAALLRKHGQ